MNLKTKIITGLIALLVAFGGGSYVGYHIPKGDVDPQDYTQTVFTPYEDGAQAYLGLLDKAQKSVYIADYSFGSKAVADKLIDLKVNRHVDVHLLLDLSQSRSVKTEAALIESMRNAGIEVVIGTSEKSHQIMHDKYTIVDGLWVESGSWNYTDPANKQANVLDIVKSPKRARMFKANWDRMHTFMQAQEAKRDQTAAPSDE